MRRSAFVSALGHSAIGLLAYFGLPAFFDSKLIFDSPNVVEAYIISEPPEPLPPPPQIDPPPPPSKASPPPIIEVTPPEPEPTIVPVKSVEPPPGPKPAVTKPVRPPPVKPRRVVEPPPKPKPEPQKLAFDSVLKRLATEPEPAPQPAPEASRKKIERTIFQFAGLTHGEIDAIRRQIEANWILPAGAREADKLSVEIRISLGPDGTVRTVEIVDTARLNRDGEEFFRSAAESAKRAVLKSNPLRGLPPEKYDLWRQMVINFDPRNILRP